MKNSGDRAMQLYCSSIGTAAVALIYVIYGVYRDRLTLDGMKSRILRERVSYMLWVMAEQVH
jgi:hypothetical protein